MGILILIILSCFALDILLSLSEKTNDIICQFLITLLSLMFLIVPLAILINFIK